ncbi:DUF1329 domain-containing protein [Telluria mixta]|uniref:DUF1329 domain-containing protein n=1 Tax=Telluria mixta TaxID=34071 RepID=A0ABT2C1N3_9BURK|nr:DUF1329 domain-containing protein [Telluria mixta]MCS0631236.1 DUF1329 domain-containing protein [Telluria mixta]WEM95776.1 DUF1329 domain-containing protein [Telluria mixta]
MRTKSFQFIGVPFLTGLLSLGGPAFAAELPEGTVISKANLDQVKNDTFMGHKIGDLLTDKMELLIRQYNKKYPLVKSPPLQMDPQYIAATKKYADQVKFDPKTREVTGYVAGKPFPNIDPADPSAGDKVIWNYYYGASTGADLNQAVWFTLASKNGFESSTHWNLQRVYNKGRLWTPDGAFPSEPTVLHKTILVALTPQDLKGVGTFTTQYDVANKPDDQWAYIKSARRIRRMSGNAWMDNVGGFDFINDDINLWNSRPSRYKSIKLLGKRWVLASTDYKAYRARAKDKAGTAGEWPHLDFSVPVAQSVQPVTPVEVWVVEGTPPSDHPYGKKIVYADTNTNVIYYAEIYDKKGDFWRWQNYHFEQRVGAKSGIKYVSVAGGEYADMKAQHVTFYMTPGVDDSGINATKFGPEILESLQ